MLLTDLTNILDTMAIGFIVLVLVITLRWLFCKGNQTFIGHIKVLSLHVKDNAMLSVGLSLSVFIVGIITQQMSDYLTDSSLDPRGLFSKEIKYFLQDEEEHRFQTLVCGDEYATKCKDNNINIGLTGLGKEVFQYRGLLHRLHSKVNTVDINKVSENCQHDDEDNSSKDEMKYAFIEEPELYLKKCNSNAAAMDVAKSLVGSVYYKAKNWAYLQAQYAVELKELQRRLDFSRSASVVFYVFLWLVVVAYPVYLVLNIISKRYKSICKLDLDCLPVSCYRYVSRVLPVAVLVLFLWCASSFSYERSENNFNERAIGYYYSYLSDIELHTGGALPEQYRKSPVQ